MDTLLQIIINISDTYNCVESEQRRIDVHTDFVCLVALIVILPCKYIYEEMLNITNTKFIRKKTVNS